jgi:acyl-CoA reductase-like NAD-dependent aldehyde dehydrogenase
MAGREEVQQWINAAQDYYQAKYAATAAREIGKILSRLPSHYLDVLWDEVTRIHSNQYKTPPDKAVIEEAMQRTDSPETYADRTEEMLKITDKPQQGESRGKRFFRLILEAMSRGEDPREAVEFDENGYPVFEEDSDAR